MEIVGLRLGLRVEDVAEYLVLRANALDELTYTEFNESLLRAEPSDTPDKVVARWAEARRKPQGCFTELTTGSAAALKALEHRRYVSLRFVAEQMADLPKWALFYLGWLAGREYVHIREMRRPTRSVDFIATNYGRKIASRYELPAVESGLTLLNPENRVTPVLA